MAQISKEAVDVANKPNQIQFVHQTRPSKRLCIDSDSRRDSHGDLASQIFSNNQIEGDALQSPARHIDQGLCSMLDLVAFLVN